MEANQERLWTFTFVALVLISLLGLIIVQGLNNGIPLFIDSIGGSRTLTGVLSTAFNIGAASGRLAGGNLADQLGRRRVMLAGGLIYCAGMLLPILIPSMSGLMLFRTIQGVGFAMATTAAAAAAADVLPPKRLGEGIGYFGLGQSLAMATGPYLGLTLFTHGGHDVLFGGLGLLTAVIFLLAWFCNYEAGQARRPLGQRTAGLLARAVERNALLPAAMNLVNSMSIALIVAFVSLYAVHRGFRQPGIFFACAAAAMIFTRMTLGRLIDRHRPLTILIPTQLVGLLALALIPLASTDLLFYLSGFAFGLSYGVAVPLLSTIAVVRTPRERWGAANATFYLSTDVGIGFGSFVWGAVIDLAGFQAAFAGGALCMALTAVIGAFCLRGPMRQRST